MRKMATTLPLKYKFKQGYPTTGSWGTVASMTTRKQESKESVEGKNSAPTEKSDPIVAFSRPPSLPPVLGPLVGVSLYNMWSSNDPDGDAS